MQDRQFYVYVHRRKVDGSIFYVGKGCGARYRQTQGRNEYWRRTAKKYGWVKEIVCANLTEHCAHCIEKILIASIPRLTNLTAGGEGASGFKHSEKRRRELRERFSGAGNPMFGRHDPLSESHKRKIGDSNRKPKPAGFGDKMSKILKGRKMDDAQKVKLKGSRNQGAKNPMHGTTREKCPRFDPTEFTFVHIDHGEVTMTTYDMERRFGLPKGCIRKVARGMIGHSKGWMLKPSDDEELPGMLVDDPKIDKLRRFAA